MDGNVGERQQVGRIRTSKHYRDEGNWEVVCRWCSHFVSLPSSLGPPFGPHLVRPFSPQLEATNGWRGTRVVVFDA